MSERSLRSAVGIALVSSWPRLPGKILQTRCAYDWHREPGRCHYCLGAPLDIGDGASGFAGAHWPEPGAEGRIENERLLQILLPHIARTLLIEQRFSALRNASAASACLMDRVPQAVLILDGEGRVLQMNRKAAGILDAGDGLIAVEGMLETPHQEDNGSLQALIAGAIHAGGRGANASVSVTRPSGARAYTLMVEPTLAVGETPGAGSVAAVVIISDPETSRPLAQRQLMRLFHLTRAEARLAARLAAGETVDAAAACLGITRRTAALHLEHVLAKTGTHRQSELVRLLLESPAALAGDMASFDP